MPSQAANVNELVTGQLVQRLELVLDQATIAGDGAVSQPFGIPPQTPASNVVSAGGALTSATAYEYWNGAIGSILGDNAELGDLSILHNSDVETAIDGPTDTRYQPLRPTPNYASIKGGEGVLIANGIVSTGTPATSYSVVGDFQQVLFGMQQSLMLEVSREGGYINPNGTTGNAFTIWASAYSGDDYVRRGGAAPDLVCPGQQHSDVLFILIINILNVLKRIIR